MEGKDEPGTGMAFAEIGELHHALEAGAITLHTPIRARFDTIEPDGTEVTKLIDTTPGRMLLSVILPRHPNVPLSLINRPPTKKKISKVTDAAYRHCRQTERKNAGQGKREQQTV